MRTTAFWRSVVGIVVFALLLLGAIAGARAADAAHEDAVQAREVIQAQLHAFAIDDAATAFSFATPAIRAQFGTPQRFLDMVRAGYPVVYRAASVVFGRTEVRGEALSQAVQMSDAGGALWFVIYRLERQPDGRWRIAGCEVVRGEGRTA